MNETISEFKFQPNKTVRYPNTLNKAVKVTVSFNEKESFTTTLIIGGFIDIKCGERPPVILISDT